MSPPRHLAFRFEHAILIGILGSIIVFVATIAFRKVELSQSAQQGHAGEICR